MRMTKTIVWLPIAGILTICNTTPLFGGAFSASCTGTCADDSPAGFAVGADCAACARTLILLCDATGGNGPLATFTCHDTNVVPTLSDWAAIAMMLLLLTGGTIVFYRKRGREANVA